MLEIPKAFDTNNQIKEKYWKIMSENLKDVTMDNQAGNQNNIYLYWVGNPQRLNVKLLVLKFSWYYVSRKILTVDYIVQFYMKV